MVKFIAVHTLTINGVSFCDGKLKVLTRNGGCRGPYTIEQV
jgi:hypothetical protein